MDARAKATAARGDAPAAPQPEGGIDPKLIDTVNVTLEAYLGQARITVAELTGLKEGSVLTLDAMLSQAIELRLNGLPVGRGELVAVGDKFGVRLTEISR